jgi:hypothetical protein
MLNEIFRGEWLCYRHRVRPELIGLLLYQLLC